MAMDTTRFALEENRQVTWDKDLLDSSIDMFLQWFTKKRGIIKLPKQFWSINQYRWSMRLCSQLISGDLSI